VRPRAPAPESVAGEARAGGTARRRAAMPLRADLFAPESPARRLLRRIGDKWTILVLCSLSDGTLRCKRTGGFPAGHVRQARRAAEGP
jgi:hypothetical protein